MAEPGTYESDMSSILAWWGLGLMLWRKVRGTALFAMLMLAYPLSFHVAYPQARYRHPIEPIMVILIVFLLSQTHELRREKA
jgi:hypothetical protein